MRLRSIINNFYFFFFSKVIATILAKQILVANFFNNYRTITKREREIYSQINRKYLNISLKMLVALASELSTIYILSFFYRSQNFSYQLHYQTIQYNLYMHRDKSLLLQFSTNWESHFHFLTILSTRCSSQFSN